MRSGSEIMNSVKTIDDDDDYDRLSELPICILQNILFKLPLEEEARTCSLSKHWNTHVWGSLPVSNFNFNFNQIENNDDEKFIQLVEESLHRLYNERFKIPDFRIFIKVFNSSKLSFFIDRWLHLVARHHLKVLCLRISTKRILLDLYQFPKIELAFVRRLRILSLSGCKLHKNSLCDGDGDGPSLAIQELYLQNVEVNNRGGAFQKFISRCSSLRKLVIKHCYGVKVLRLFSHPKLEELHVNVWLEDYAQTKLLKRIEVDSLCLQTIICSGINIRKPLFVKATRCKNLRHLDITSTRMKDTFFENLATDFPLLQTLCLRGCDGRSSLYKLRHPLLRTLELYFNDFKQLVIDTPKLYVFKYRESTPKLNLDPPCSSLRESYQSLLLRRQLNTSSFLQLRDYLTKFKKHNLTLSLHIHSTTEFNMDEVTTHDLSCHVQLLKVRLYETSRSCAAALFDGLFWSCHPKYLRVIYEKSFNSDSLKFMCEILKSGSKEEDFTCCKTRHVKCWRHHLKEATIKGIDPDNVAMSEMVQQRLATKKQLYFSLRWL